MAGNDFLLTRRQAKEGLRDGTDRLSNSVLLSFEASRSRDRVAIALLLVFGLGGTIAAPTAAKLSSFLTAKDLARPLLLDQNGTQLQLPSASSIFTQHSRKDRLRLIWRFRFPAASTYRPGTSTIFTGQGGPAVGPLDFNAAVKAKVDAALAASGLARRRHALPELCR